MDLLHRTHEAVGYVHRPNDALSWRGMDSRSIFVVQRTFTTVRRGYDPDEVDRHLQLVAEMFNRGRTGEQRREAERAQAEARHELEAARLEAEATLEGARKRADADIAAAAAALEQARAQAAEIVASPRREGQERGEAERDAMLADVAAAREEHERI